jgi:hypothetical protein
MPPKSGATSIPSPVGGLNDRDSIADMPISDAALMVNWWPYPSYLGVRKGSASHVTGFPAPVEAAPARQLIQLTVVDLVC